MSRTPCAIYLGLLTVALALPACNGGGGGAGGGIGPVPEEFRRQPTVPTIDEAASDDNDQWNAADVRGLPEGGAGRGDLGTPGDVDFWAFDAVDGAVVSVELYAGQLDQALTSGADPVAWDTAPNLPLLIVWDVDGTSILRLHVTDDAAPGVGWGAGLHDQDIPRFRVPADGTYFLSVSQQAPGEAGGSYAVAIKPVPIAGLQSEVEGMGVQGLNDNRNTAEPIVPGTLHAWHVDGENDFFKFAVAAPSIVRFETVGHRNGISRGDDAYFDPFLTLYDRDGATVLRSVDDAFFFDSALAYKLATPGTYFVDVRDIASTGDGEYFLDYALTPLSGAVPEVEGNNTPATATAIGYGTIVTGSSAPADPDYYRFAGLAGDMVRVRVFDGENAELATQTVSVTLLDGAGDPLPAADGGTLRTIRTIVQETGTFLIRVDPAADLTAYCLDLQLVAAAPYEVEPNDNGGNLDVDRANGLDDRGRAAGVIDLASDVDFFSFQAQENELVTFAIFAARADLAFHSDGHSSLSGHGSALQPVIAILDDTGAILAGTLFDPSPLSADSVSGESITNGLATQSVSFVAPASGTFFVAVGQDASDPGAPSPEHYYAIERR